MPVKAEAPLVMDDPFERSLDGLAQDLPEIAEKREFILRGGQELIDEWQIKPEFFDDKSRVVFFAALAERNDRLNESEDRSGKSYKEKEFIADAVTMLAAPHSERMDELRKVIYSADLFDESTIERAYDKYTNKQITAELQKALDEGMLDDIRKRMGVNKDNEDPFELRVLNIGQRSTMYGMRPDPPSGFLSLPEDHPNLRQYKETTKDYEMYSAGIKHNTEDFLAATGKHSVPVAWVTKGGGETHLNLPLPTAEKLLYGDEVLLGNDEFVARDFADEAQATLEHEYAHTQGGLAVDGVSFGIMAEECRAELMAGNKMGYQDAKGLLGIDIPALTGAQPLRYMESHEKGGDAAEFYTLFAGKMGIQRTLEFALTVPDGYLSDERPLQKRVNRYLGGINGLEERLYDANPAWVDERIESWAEGNYKRQSVGQWLALRKNMNGLGFVTDKMRDALTRKRTEHNWKPY